MRDHARNAIAEPIVRALVNGDRIAESEAWAWVRNLQRAEREGFCMRIIRRLDEARYFHGPRDKVELLDSSVVREVIREECVK